MFKSNVQRGCLRRDYGAIKVRAQAFSSSAPIQTRRDSIQDFRRTECDLNVVRELLDGTDHLPASTWCGSLTTTRLRYRVFKRYPRVTTACTRWVTLLHSLTGKCKELATRSCCRICRGGTESFFTNLALLNLASQVDGCMICGLLIASLSLLLTPIEDWILWADRACNKDSICILANVVNGKLKELRVWNCHLIDFQGPALVIQGQIWLELCGSEDPHFPFLIPAPIVSACSNHPTNYELIKRWILECDKDHADCTPSGDLELPCRLVHLRSEGIRLVDAPGRARYLTLSYCWGESLPFKLTADKIDALRDSISFELLPKTFQDFVILARILGIEYVWIDALCIVQDDPQDWQDQSSRMAMIYSNAYLNISVTWAPDCDAGIFCTKTRTNHSDMRTFGAPPLDLGEVWNILIEARVGWGEKFPSILMREVLDHSDFTTILEDRSRHSPLLQRAWAMQERLLSQRTVHFGNSELIWECTTCTRCECGRLDRFGDRADLNENEENYKAVFASIKTPQKGETPTSVLGKWLRMVEIYSSCLLKFENDRLAALSGLARALKGQHKLGDYIAGVWSEELPQGLAWVTADTRSNRQARSRAPSWSWASIEGAISYSSPRHFRLYARSRNSASRSLPLTSVCAIVKDIQFELAGIDPFQDLKSARVVLSAPTAEVILMKAEMGDEQHWTDGCSWILKNGVLRLGFRPDIESDFDHNKPSELKICLTVLLGRTEKATNQDFRALVLEKLSDTESSYRRIGTIKGSKYEYPAYQSDGYVAEGITWEEWHGRLVSTLETWFAVENSEVVIV